MRPDALILAFDTSAAHCAAALLQGDTVLAQAEEPMAKGQAERLIPLLEEVLADAGKRWSDLDALAVGTGPGNFTGVRIAVAAARGLALGLDIPALGVTTLEARAHGLPRPFVVAEDARRGAFYVQTFGPDTPARLTETVPDGPQHPPLFPLAEAIARVAATRTPDGPPAPFYLRGADAAPPSDPPPVILDVE
ncbi:tRNA (adenosine(37)-N6)-threonylcarbamoyltransferase complex dimerization subunit type 1 TsaB [Falsirhodobacter sp. 20TX0035]|uniref:tRNA (adenosine(37)-N6)-threonylcarbamoyltransferase complex dimerization subunit type 1 TsaB n=1 Tax=Falsirhodobacter sp. 20TX0035 TaxID=3022019 RepID=UPI00232B81FD|nr:tRNA (adenosine(37)-N6)-threonylcarbamoyltransferase complex dimerization subunit type 1 TsaB [Falsirhodobacter sp. 20TX0035]MDB6453866.1 tRNA (adenosine(37)-N6)-threonylcarbamoyltransferase complex dimerization subunit type 1 TsaB [Falsirhodobacter sp. 20TX0035]